MQPTTPKLRGALMTMRIIWVAMLLAQVMLAVAFWTVVPDSPGASPELLKYMLCGMGVAIPLGAPLIQGIVWRGATQNQKGDGLSLEAVVPIYFPSFIVGLALRESGAIFASVCLMLFRDPIAWAVPAAVAFGMSLVALPSRMKLEAAHTELTGRRSVM